MSRLFTDGAEAGDTLAWTIVGSGITSQAGTARIGGRAYQFNPGASSTSLRKDITAASEFYVRMVFQYNNTNVTPGFEWDSSGASVLGSWRVNSSQNAEIRVGSTLSFTGTEIFQLNTWYVIEIHVKIADAGGVIEYKVDGVLNAGFSGDTKPGSDTQAARLFLVKYGNSSTIAYFDDFAVNDTTGVVDNSWCGDAHIYALTPNANGNSSQFTGSDGNSTDNYLLVDEVPSNSDTDYVESLTSGHKDFYGLSDLPSLPSGSTISRVLVETRARETTAAGDPLQLGVRSSTTESFSSSIVLSTTFTAQRAEFLTDPNTLVDWTESGVNAMEAGIKVP